MEPPDRLLELDAQDQRGPSRGRAVQLLRQVEHFWSGDVARRHEHRHVFIGANDQRGDERAVRGLRSDQGERSGERAVHHPTHGRRQHR